MHIKKLFGQGVRHVAKRLAKLTRSSIHPIEFCDANVAKQLLGDSMLGCDEIAEMWGIRIPFQATVPIPTLLLEKVAQLNQAGARIKLIYCIGMSLQSQEESALRWAASPFKYYTDDQNGLAAFKARSSQSGYRLFNSTLVPLAAEGEMPPSPQVSTVQLPAACINIVAECVRSLHRCRSITLLQEEFHAYREKNKRVERIGDYDLVRESMTLLRFKFCMSGRKTGYFAEIPANSPVSTILTPGP